MELLEFHKYCCSFIIYTVIDIILLHFQAQEPQPSTSYQTIVVVVTEPTPQVSASEINILPQIAEPPVDLNLLNPPTLTDEAPYYVSIILYTYYYLGFYSI